MTRRRNGVMIPNRLSNGQWVLTITDDSELHFKVSMPIRPVVTRLSDLDCPEKIEVWREPTHNFFFSTALNPLLSISPYIETYPILDQAQLTKLP